MCRVLLWRRLLPPPPLPEVEEVQAVEMVAMPLSMEPSSPKPSSLVLTSKLRVMNGWSSTAERLGRWVGSFCRS